MGKTPQPPGHLNRKGRTWWLKVVSEYQLEVWHLEMLTQAAECLDLIETAQKQITKDGPVYTDRFGAPRPHAAVKIANDAKQLFSRLVKNMGLLDAE